MVKKVTFLILLSLTLQAKSLYEHNCVSCHEGMTITLDKFFFRYLLKYSSEAEVKKALFTYIKNPKTETSILEPWLINRIGVKKRSTLSDKELHEALDDYWTYYQVFGKLK
jgi:hypothetical protein